MPRKVFTAGEVLAAADVNEFLMDQAVQTFASSAARGSAIGTATEGMVTYLNDIDALSVHNGTEFVTNRPIMTFAGTAARGSAIPSPVDGMTTYLEDLDRYDSYSGAAWVPVVSTSAWISYTPTTGNLTLGNGTISAEYNVVGKTIFLAIRFTLGSTSSITANPTFTLPSGFTSAPLSTFSPVGTGLATISSTSYIMTTVAISSNRVASVVNNSSGTYAFAADISSTVPATWATGSIYEINATLEIA
jgi:hypothetical protein